MRMNITGLIAATLLFPLLGAPADARPDDAVLLFSADVQGKATVCRKCPARNGLGGFARRATYLRQARADGTHVVLLDAGNALFGTDSLASEGRVVTEAYAALGYRAINIGYRDFRLGKARTLSLLRGSKLEPVSANILDSGTGQPLFATHVIEEVGPRRVAIVGLTEPPVGLSFLPHLQAQLEGVRIAPPEEALGKVLDELGRFVHGVVVLYYGSPFGLRSLLDRHGSRLTAVLVGGCRPEHLPRPEAPLVAAVDEFGRALGRVTIGSAPTIGEVPLSEKLAPDPAIAKLVEKHVAPAPGSATPAEDPPGTEEPTPERPATAEPAPDEPATEEPSTEVPEPEVPTAPTPGTEEPSVPVPGEAESPTPSEETGPATPTEGAPEDAEVVKLRETEPNEGSNRAQKLPFACDVSGTVRPGGDSDWYEIRLDRPCYIRAEVSGVKDVDLTLRIQDRRSRIVVRLDGQGVGEPEELLWRLPRGTYMLIVDARPTRGTTAGGDYLLTVRPTTLLRDEPSTEEIRAAIRRGLGYLSAQQQEDGSWEAKTGVHGVTGLALMAFLGEKAGHDGPIGKAVAYFKEHYVAPGASRGEFLEACHGGSLIGRRSGHFLYEQAIAVLALSEYLEHHEDEEIRAMAKAGVDLLLRSQNGSAKPEALRGPVPENSVDHGGWRYQPQDLKSDLSASGWCLIALAAAEQAGFEIPERVRKEYMVFCRRCFSEKHGTYVYFPTGGNQEHTNTTNAVGVLTTLLCVGGECPVVRRGLKQIRMSPPNWNVEGGRRGRWPFYYWYYATRAMYMAGGDYWKTWQAAIVPMLLKHQNADGSWDPNLDEEKKVGERYTTALGVLILQICSGNPPSYLKGLDLGGEAYPCPKCLEDIEALLEKAERDGRSKEELIEEIRRLLRKYYGE
jgi:hypothetical protein